MLNEVDDQVLADFRNAQTNYLYSKNLIKFCEETQLSQPNLQLVIEHVIRDWKMSHYVKLTPEDRNNSKDSTLLGFTDLKALSTSENKMLLQELNNKLPQKWKKQFEELNKACNGELEKMLKCEGDILSSTDTNLEAELTMRNELSAKIAVSHELKTRKSKLFEECIQLQNLLSSNVEHDADLAKIQHDMAAVNAKALQAAIQIEMYNETSQTQEAFQEVQSDIEKEIENYKTQLKTLKTENLMLTLSLKENNVKK